MPENTQKCVAECRIAFRLNFRILFLGFNSWNLRVGLEIILYEYQINILNIFLRSLSRLQRADYPKTGSSRRFHVRKIEYNNFAQCNYREMQSPSAVELVGA